MAIERKAFPARIAAHSSAAGVSTGFLWSTVIFTHGAGGRDGGSLAHRRGGLLRIGQRISKATRSSRACGAKCNDFLGPLVCNLACVKKCGLIVRSGVGSPCCLDRATAGNQSNPYGNLDSGDKANEPGRAGGQAHVVSPPVMRTNRPHHLRRGSRRSIFRPTAQ
jgi:hypothetical protein